MAAVKINIDALNSRETELLSLISDTYRYMELKEPNLQKYVKHTKEAVYRKSEWLGTQLSKAVQSGDFRKVIIGGALFGTALVIATGAEFVSDKIAYKQAEKRLLPYFQELASKQGLIQKELILTVQEKEKNIALLKTDAEKYKQKIQELEEKQMLLTDLLTRFDNLEKAIAK